MVPYFTDSSCMSTVRKMGSASYWVNWRLREVIQEHSELTKDPPSITDVLTKTPYLNLSQNLNVWDLSCREIASL